MINTNTTDEKHVQTDTCPLKSREQNNVENTFMFARSLSHEISIIFGVFIKIAFGCILELAPQFVGQMFVGHLPNTNTALLLSACGLSLNYANITGLSVGWGFSSGLLTLLPQCIGSDRKELIAHYLQRSFYICLFVLMIATILQIYSGQILCYILNYDINTDPICGYITSYCIVLIPFLYFVVLFTNLQRVIQNLDYNTELFVIIFISNILTPAWNYLFVYYLEFGYIGTAITMDVVMLCALIMCCFLLIYKGYSYIFKPVSIRVVLQSDKVYEYLGLSLPGLLQGCSSWWIGELVCILAGFITKPYISVSSTVICYSMFNILSMFSVGLGNSATIRIGKYIGLGSMYYAKRVCKLTAVIDIILLIIISLICIIFKNDLPKVYSSDVKVIEMASELMYFLVLISIGYSFFRVLAGVFQGLGKPTIVAIILCVSQGIVGLGTTLILLFVLDYKNFTDYGLFSMWSCIAFGYYLAAFTIFSMLFYRNKTIWIDARNESELRLKKDNNNFILSPGSYGSIN